MPEKWTDYADTLVLASVTSPLLPCAVYNPGMGGINALVAAGGSQSAWDFGRSRFYAFCSGGILAVNSTEGLGRMAATPVDYRVCPGPGAVNSCRPERVWGGLPPGRPYKAAGQQSRNRAQRLRLYRSGVARYAP